MLGDPLALYRMPRESQIVALGYLQWQADPDPVANVAELDVDGFVRVGGREAASDHEVDGSRVWDNPDPTQGARMARPRGVVAVSSEARQRADRFRVR